MCSFLLSNTDPIGSCAPNFGLWSKNVSLMGSGDQRRLCSVEPQLQQCLYTLCNLDDVRLRREGLPMGTDQQPRYYLSPYIRYRSRGHRNARVRSQPIMDLYGSGFGRHLKHRGRHRVVQCDMCCGAVRLSDNSTISLLCKHESSSPEGWVQRHRPVKCCL